MFIQEQPFDAQNSELLYLWIEQTRYDCFQNCNFNFSSNYNFEFDGKQLKGSELDGVNLYRNTNISNITAIVGANGVGKTTLLNFVSNLSGRARKTFSIDNGKGNYIAVFKCDGKILVNNYTDCETIECVGNIFTDKFAISKKSKDYNEIYNNTTIVYLSLEELSESSFERKENSNFIPLTPYVLRKKNTNDILLNKSPRILYDKLDFDFNNESLILVKYLSSINDKNVLIRVSFNTLWKILKERYKSNNIDHFFNNGTQNVHIKKAISEIGLTGMMVKNLIEELIRIWEIPFDMFKNVFSNNVKEVIKELRILKSELPSRDLKEYTSQAINEIEKFSRLEKWIVRQSNVNDKNEEDTYFFDIPVCKLDSLLDFALNGKYSFILKYFNFHLERSCGEFSRIRHEAYIYYLSNKEKFSSNASFPLKKNIIFMLDEVDTHLHPEWQRTLINNLINSITKNLSNYNVQIIFTTHSPIILSDIPNGNIIYISKKDGKRDVFKKNDRTFGANIHDLYNDSFFFSNNITIGEYSKNFINRLYNDILEKRIDHQTAAKCIDLVGEEILRNELVKILENKGENFTNNNLSKDAERLANLESQLLEILEEIRILKNDKN